MSTTPDFTQKEVSPSLSSNRTSGGNPDPVEIASQLLGDVGLPPGRKAHRHDQGWGVGHTYCGGRRGAGRVDYLATLYRFIKTGRSSMVDQLDRCKEGAGGGASRATDTALLTIRDTRARRINSRLLHRDSVCTDDWVRGHGGQTASLCSTRYFARGFTAFAVRDGDRCQTLQRASSAQIRQSR